MLPNLKCYQGGKSYFEPSPDEEPVDPSLSSHFTSVCTMAGFWVLNVLTGLEEVHHSLVSHPLQNNAESDEHARPSDTRTDERNDTWTY